MISFRRPDKTRQRRIRLVHDCRMRRERLIRPGWLAARYWSGTKKRDRIHRIPEDRKRKKANVNRHSGRVLR